MKNEEEEEEEVKKKVKMECMHLKICLNKVKQFW